MDEELERLSTEHARLSDQLITAEQEERRRLALFLHDGPVQSMSGIALMLDAVIAAVEARAHRRGDARARAPALEKQRETIRSLRDLSFELEPVVLRDQGFGPAVRALADQLGMANQIQIDLDVEAAESARRARAGGDLPDHPRGAPPGDPARAADTHLGPRRRGDGRRRGRDRRRRAGRAPPRGFDAIAERARSLSGEMTVDPRPDGGTSVRDRLPAVPSASLESRAPCPQSPATACSSRSRPATSCSTARASRPRSGSVVELDGQGSWVVNRISPSPLPQDRRPCAYLLPDD